MTISEEIDRIAKRLLADVDDRMEFAGTEWKSKEQASKGVQEALDRHNAQLLELIEKRELEAENNLLIKTAKKTNEQYDWSEVDNWVFEFGSSLRVLYIKRKLYQLKQSEDR